MNNIIYHNPRCSKSREALRLLQQHEQSVAVRDYLVDAPSPQEIVRLSDVLNARPYGLVRHKDLAKEGTYPPKDDDAAWAQVLSEDPRLLERPIVSLNGKWVVARPPEKLLELL